MSSHKANASLKVILSKEGMRTVHKKKNSVDLRVQPALQRVPKIPKKKSRNQKEAGNSLAISPMKAKEEEERRERERIQQAKDQLAKRTKIIKNLKSKEDATPENTEAIKIAQTIKKINKTKKKTEELAEEIKKQVAKTLQKIQDANTKSAESKNKNTILQTEQEPIQPTVTEERKIERDRQAALRRAQVPKEPIPDEITFEAFETIEEIPATQEKVPDTTVMEIDTYLQDADQQQEDTRVQETAPRKKIRCRKCHGRGHSHLQCSSPSAKWLKWFSKSTGVDLRTKTPKKVKDSIKELIPVPPNIPELDLEFLEEELLK